MLLSPTRLRVCGVRATIGAMMTPREQFIAALERRHLKGRVPHFELVFFLTMEAFGRVHPSHRHYGQWLQMEEKERQLHRVDMADLYIATAERYEHSAIFLHPNPGSEEEVFRLVDLVRERSGGRFFLMMHGDATFSIPDGTRMAEFAYRIADEPERVCGGGARDGGSSARPRGEDARARGSRRLCSLRRLLLQHRLAPQPRAYSRGRHALPGPPHPRVPGPAATTSSSIRTATSCRSRTSSSSAARTRSIRSIRREASILRR